jgi:hypothetical protein
VLQVAVGELLDDLAARRADGDVADNLVQGGARLPDGGCFLDCERNTAADAADRFCLGAV